MKQLNTILASIFLVAALMIFPQLTARSTSAGNLSPTPDPEPDLIVDQASLRQHWVVRVEDFRLSFAAW